MFNFFKIKFKQLIMILLYLILELWALIKGQKRIENPKKIVILFLKNLGIGDLVMLSPAIQGIADSFSNSEIDLVTWVPEVIKFERINFVKPENYQFKDVDLVISPTLNLKHFPYIFKAKNFIGYFAWTKIQSNFKVKKYSYKLRGEHYLLRGIRLIKSLNKEEGIRLDNNFNGHTLIYPDLLIRAPQNFESYKDYKYLAIAPVSKWPDRQWPIERLAFVLEGLLNKGLVERIVFLGDSSDYDRNFIKDLMNLLEKKFPKYFFINSSGNDLKEAIFIIKNSSLFIGLDSAPAHFAYLVAKRVLSIFITVDPMWRIPANNNLGRIRCLFPINPNFNLYSGLAPADAKKCKKYIESISEERILKEAEQLLNNN